MRSWVPLILAATRDAFRAFLVVPQRFAKEQYAASPDGSWMLISRQSFPLKELVVKKFVQSALTFNSSVNLRMARKVVIPRLGAEGLLANLLHVLEVLQRTREDALISIDWVLRGDEPGFRYGKRGDDVWGSLFAPIGRPLPKEYYSASSELDYAFWGTGKDYLSGAALAFHRSLYHETFCRYIRVVNERILSEVNHTTETALRGCYCIGVHRRVNNAKVANCHNEGRVPTVAEICGAVMSHISMINRPCWRLYLATDDSLAIEEFRRTFSDKLICRPAVRRTSKQAREVHMGEWGTVSLSDAEDALIDTILLSRCDVLFHASSSISTVAAIMNPRLATVRVRGGCSPF